MMAVLPCFLLFSCSPSKPGCTDADLTALMRAHESRLAAACINQRADCSQRKAENERFSAELDRYVGCR